MRSDEKLDLPDSLPGEVRRQAIPKGVSFSGHERNRLFLNRGDRYLSASTVSGLDSPADGRALGLFDYDRDGWTDIAIVSSNVPLLQLFRNEVGKVLDKGGAFVAVKLVGGNREAKTSKDWSARDGYGAKIRVKTGERTLLRETRCGEGMASQDSATILIGIGTGSAADSLTVHWPSGRVTEVPTVENGRLVTVYEDPTQSGNDKAFKISEYRMPGKPAGD